MAKTEAQRTAAKKVAQKRTAKMAAAKAGDLEVTEASDWKKDVADKTGETKLEVPSGHVCLVKLVGLEPFFKQGLIPNNLLPIVSEALADGKGLSPKDTKALITDPEMIASMLELTDRIVCETVVQPKVSPVPEDGKRQDDVLYVDEVDLQDKMFIFQFVVGGTRNLEKFRGQQETSVAALADEQAVLTAAK